MVYEVSNVTWGCAVESLSCRVNSFGLAAPSSSTEIMSEVIVGPVRPVTP
jgi:hypothetical protein